MSCIIHQMMICTDSRVKPIHEQKVLAAKTQSEMYAYILSSLGTSLLWRLMTFACHSEQTSRIGGKMKLTRLLGIKMIRNVMTRKPTSIRGE